MNVENPISATLGPKEIGLSEKELSLDFPFRPTELSYLAEQVVDELARTKDVVGIRNQWTTDSEKVFEFEPELDGGPDRYSFTMKIVRNEKLYQVKFYFAGEFHAIKAGTGNVGFRGQVHRVAKFGTDFIATVEFRDCQRFK